MLSAFRKRKSFVKAVLWCVLILVSVSMVVTLIPGMGGSFGDTTTNPVVAEVEGDKITAFEVQQSTQQVALRNRIPTEMIPFYTNQILNEMILEKATVREAGRLGLQVDERELLSLLKKDPTLFPGGKFVGQQQYENMIIDQTGMNVAQFEDRFRRSILINKLRLLVTDPLVVTPEEVRAAFIKENEKVTVDFALLNPDDFKKDAGNPTDTQIQDYFTKNKVRYEIKEMRLAKVVLFGKDQLGDVAVPDAEVKKYYESRLDDYRNPERVTVRHILFKADPKDPAKLAEAKKKAEDLLKQLKGGADFAELAKKNSEDTGTAPSGGLLSNIGRGQTVPEFEKVAFSLEPGAVSDPVQTSYGIHLIQGVTHEQARLRPFDEMKASIQNLLKDDKVRVQLASTAEQAAGALAKSPSDIDAVAAKYHGEVLDLAPFAKGALLPRIGQSDTFMEEVFGLEKNRAGSPIAVGEGYAIPVLLDVLPSHPPEFSEAKEQSKEDLILERSKEIMMTKAAELAKLAEQQKDIKKAAQSMGITVKASPSITSEGTIPGVGSVRDIASKMFSLAVGGLGGPETLSGGQFVYQVASKEMPKDDDLEGKRQEIQAQLLNQKRQLAFDVFQDDLKSKLVTAGRIKIHQDVLTQIVGLAGTTR